MVADRATVQEDADFNQIIENLLRETIRLERWFYKFDFCDSTTETP